MRPVFTFVSSLSVEKSLPVVNSILRVVCKKLAINDKLYISDFPKTVVQSEHRLLNVLSIDHDTCSRLEIANGLFRHLRGQKTFHIYLEARVPVNGCTVQLSYRSNRVFFILENESIVRYDPRDISGGRMVVSKSEIVKSITQTFKGHF